MNYLVIDGFGLAYKSYYAYSNLTTNNGIESGCVYGFVVSLKALKKKYPAFHFVVAWDRGYTYRKQIYANYKANRSEFSIDPHIEDLKRILTTVNITQIEFPGEEADDVIASFASKNSENNLIYVYSADKDLLQLVKNGKVIVIKPKSASYPEKFFDEEAVYQEYGVEPRNLAGFQAFRGDSVDNIPGVPRFPSKVIASLISKYENPENIYNSLDSETLTDFQRKSINDSKSQVYLNYDLTRLRCNLDYDITEGSLNEEMLRAFLNKYEIKAISAEVFSAMFEKESTFLSRRSPAIQNYSLF